MKRPLYGFAVLIGIVGGISINTWQIAHPVQILYAREPDEPREILIEVRINWIPERIEKEIRETFPEDPDTAVAVAMAESRLRTDAYNPEAHTDRHGNVICTGSLGVMQIACVHKKRDPEALKDVQTNLKVARAVYDEAKRRTGNGWTPWGAYTDGNYKKFLP